MFIYGIRNLENSSSALLYSYRRFHEQGICNDILNSHKFTKTRSILSMNEHICKTRTIMSQSSNFESYKNGDTRKVNSSEFILLEEQSWANPIKKVLIDERTYPSYRDDRPCAYLPCGA